MYSVAASDFTAPQFRFWNGSGSSGTTFLTINTSTGTLSSNSTIITGITNISNTLAATTVTSAALVVAGGSSIRKNLIVENSIGITHSTDNLGIPKLILFSSTGSLTLSDSSSFTGFSTFSSGSLKVSIPTSTNEVIFSAGSYEALKIKNASKELVLLGNSYSLLNGGYSSSDLSLVGNTSPSVLNMYSNTNVTSGTVNVALRLFNIGTASSTTNCEWLELGVSGGNYSLGSKNSGTGSIRDLVISDNLTISKSNNFIRIESSKSSTNSSTGGLVILGSTIGGALTLAGGAAIAKDLYVGGNEIVTGTLNTSKLILGTAELFTTVNTLTLDSVQVSIASSTVSVYNPDTNNSAYSSQLMIFGKGTTGSTNSEWLELGPLNTTNGFGIITNATGTGTVRPLNLGNVVTLSGSGTSGSTLLSGTLSVANQTTFGGSVLVNGTLTLSSGGNLVIGTNNTTAITVGNLRLTGTEDSLSLSTGALVVSGGIGVAKKVRIGDTLFVQNGSWSSNGNDVFINASNNSIYLRPNSGSALNQILVNSSGTLTITSTTDALDASTGSIISSGGLGIAKRAIVGGGITAGSSAFTSVSTQSAIITTSSIGTLLVSGSSTIGTNLIVAGTTNLTGVVSILNTIDSNDTSTGSLVVSGGAGIRKNLVVGGDTILSGNLTVNGTTTTINSQNQLLKDNIFILNSGPVGSRDSGFIIQRFQSSNDSSLGDVVLDSPIESYTLGLQSGASSSQIILPGGASSSDNAYNGWWIKITSGFSSGQVRQITGYTGSTRIAQLASPFTSQNPANGDTLQLFNKPYVGLIYRESNDVFSFTGMINDTSVSSTGLLGLEALSTLTTFATTGTLRVTSTVESSNIGTGAVICSGGMGINKSVQIGGDLTVNGVNITPTYGDITKVQTFTGAQNASSASITGLAFDTTYTNAFDIFLFIRVLATTNRYANYHIRGVWKGGTTFEVVSGYVGDDLGISFAITSSGQITYSSPSYSGFTSMTMRFKASTL
jgi:hypothetical protein